MSAFRQGFFATASLGLLLLGGTAALRAQPNANFRLPATLPGNQAAQAVAAADAANASWNASLNPYINPVNPGAVTAGLSTPYLGSGNGTGSLVNPGASSAFPPSYGGFYPGDVGGALFGVAAVTGANAQWYATIQQARILKAQANQAAIDTRRRLIDQIRYERMSTPTPEDVREREMEVALRRSRRNPPFAEILSAESLNSLFNNLAKLQGQGYKGPRVDLDEDTLRHVNVTTGTGGNIGLLKDGGKLQWPAALQRPEYAEPEKNLATLLPTAIQQVKFNNSVDGNVAKDIQAAFSSLEDTLAKNINELTPTQYIESRRYLNFLKDGLRALQDPKAADYLNGKYTAKGRTVAELVKYMTENGLKFAPATPGDEGAYRALQFSLVAYDDGIAQVAASGKP